LALLRALMNETLTGLVVARCAQEAGSCGPAVAPPLLFTSARLDLVAHADPFHEPCRVVPDMILERAPDPMNLVDLDPVHGAAPRQMSNPIDQR